MKIIDVKIKDLRPADYNPRKWDEGQMAQLKESISRFGFVDPIIINSAPERANIVIGGHFRLQAAKELGFEEVPVVYVDIPDIKREQELNIRLNRNLGQWDYDLLANFEEETLLDVGFKNDELDQIFGLEEADDFNEQAEFEKTIKEPRGVKVGDLWQLGEHRLVVGDSTDRKNWEKVMGGEQFDFLFTDPPYKLAYSNTRVRKVKTKKGWATKKERIYSSVGETDVTGHVKPQKGSGSKGNRFYQGVTERGVPAFDEWLMLANEFQNPKGANVMIFENWRNMRALWDAIEKYWKIMNMVIWHLPNRHQGFSARRRFYSKYDIAAVAGDGEFYNEDEEGYEEYLHEKAQKLLDNYEVVLYGQKGDSDWNKAKNTRYWQTGDVITWVAGSESQTGQNIIFGTKPVQILVPYIKILSPRNGIVMEPFCGSGSTIIACEIMQRKCRAIELSPMYAEVIINRFERFSGKVAVLLEKGLKNSDQDRPGEAIEGEVGA